MSPRLACIGILGLLAGSASAGDFFAGPHDYRAHVSRLQPGDRLLLAPGDYREGLSLHGLAGSTAEPIIIQARDPAARPRFHARSGRNTVSLADVRHLTLRDLELDGGNLRVDAIKAEGHSRFADFITLERLVIHDYAASQQNVGISTKCPAFGWVIRNNRIERVGTGMYLGDADGSDPFVHGLIEGNRISDTRGYNLQVKHQKTVRPGGHAGPHDTIIRYNVFSKAGGVPSEHLRPNVLLGHLPLDGVGSTDRYLVYGNVFEHNPGEALLQAEGRVAVYGNVFVNGTGDAVHIQPHNDVPRDIAIFSNVVVASGIGIRVRTGPDKAYRQSVTANLIAAPIPLDASEASHNTLLPYRAEWTKLAASEVAGQLLAAHRLPPVPAARVPELSTYPDWQGIPRLEQGVLSTPPAEEAAQ